MAIKVFVCGDSFMSRDPNFPGEHFSEQLTGDQVVNLARPGVGNIDICMQLQEAFLQGATCVIVGTSDPGRIEIPYGKYKGCQLHNFREGADRCFISDTIPTLIGEEPDLVDKYTLPTEVRTAVKDYFTHIYDHELKNQVDSWALGFWFLRMEAANIKFIVLPKSFCIYEYAAIHGATEPRVFHTNIAIQQRAAMIINEKINSLRV